MKICVVGSGYVGLVTGCCLAEIGNHVICADLDQSKIDGLNNGVLPIYEPGLDEMAERNTKQGRLTFSADPQASVKGVDVVFVAVGTPSRSDGGEWAFFLFFRYNVVSRQPTISTLYPSWL